MRTLKALTIAAVSIIAVIGTAKPVKLHVTEPPAEPGKWNAHVTEIEPVPIPTDAAAQRMQNRTTADKITMLSAPPPGYRYTWNVVFLIYPSVDVITTRSGVASRFTYTMSPSEIADAKNAMASAAEGVFAGSDNYAHMTVTVVEVGRTLTSLARAGEDIYYWPDASITGPELSTYCTGGKADSAIIFWPSRNPSTGEKLNNDYWGLAYGEIEWYTSYVGYSTVSNILPPDAFGYYPGEVFVHEWLHPTGGYYEDKGALIPNLDASGSYKPCPTCGSYTNIWGDGYMEYYRDYMTGQVWNPSASRYEGIQPAHWESGTPTNTVIETAVKGWEIY